MAQERSIRTALAQVLLNQNCLMRLFKEVVVDWRPGQHYDSIVLEDHIKDTEKVIRALREDE